MTDALQRVDDLALRSGQCTSLANVLLMTQQMVQLARDADWDAVAALEVDRRALLSETFSEPVPPEHSEIFSEALAAMLHLNEELMSSLQNARGEAAAQQSAQIRTRQGIGEYLDVDEHR